MKNQQDFESAPQFEKIKRSSKPPVIGKGAQSAEKWKRGRADWKKAQSDYRNETRTMKGAR